LLLTLCNIDPPSELASLRAQNADLVAQLSASHIVAVLGDVAALRSAANKPRAQVSDPTTQLELGEVVGRASACQAQWLAGAAACTAAAQLATSQQLDLRIRLEKLAAADLSAAAAASEYVSELRGLQQLCASLGTLLVDTHAAKERHEREVRRARP
jgi:hypothetical protein